VSFGPIGRGRRPALTDAETLDQTFVIVWLATIVFGALTVQGLLARHQLNASQSWPSADGQIETSELVVLRGSGRSGPCIRARITYSYKIGVDSYLGRRMGFVEADCGLKIARLLVSRNPVGTRVPIYYQPDDPRQAVLDRSVEQAPGSLLLVAVMGTLILLGIAIFETRSAADTRRKAAAEIARNREAPVS
jgi:hypothetical protein